MLPVPKKLLSLRKLTICIDLVQHYVNYDAGQRHVQPYRVNKPRELLMRSKVPSQPFNQGNDHKRCDECGEDGVRGQDSEIDRANYALTGEFSWPDAEIIRSQGVVGEIADQEKSRHDACRQHAETMRANPSPHYEEES